MDVVVENLSKSFGSQKAVDSVSFSVKKGEILGFLGPNGAGKTTIMKIITCFLFRTREMCASANTPFTNTRTNSDRL